MEYEGKIKCERCNKPIGELLKIVNGEVKHQPYISYRKWGVNELCNICYTEIQNNEKRQAWRREQGLI